MSGPVAATATQAALDALHVALAAIADSDTAALTVVRRNRALEDLAAEVAGGGGLRSWANLLDGRQVAAEELLGAGEPAYEIEHRAVIEWIVVGHDDAPREAVFHAGLAAIEAALAADRTLGGAVADVRLAAPPTVTDDRFDGGAPFKSAEVPVDLLFVADMPV